MPAEQPPSRTDLLARSIDEKATFFQFGYQICVLETALEPAPGMRSGPTMTVLDIRRILSALAETASRSNLLEPLCKEMADIVAILDARSKETDSPDPGLQRLLRACARRWFKRVKGMPGRSNALALDIAFSLDMAGFGDIAVHLFEAIVCMETGAFRASGMMSRLAMEKALGAAGAPTGSSLESQLEWASENGRISSGDQRCAMATIWPGRLGEWDRSFSERALQNTVRLAKKALSREMERALLEAAKSFSGR